MVRKTISHYKILSELGQGGMGVVYKAEDTKLRRTVALKFLRSDLIEDPEHRERFLREAQAAAALDHPNICTVHEIDEVDGETLIAMVYLEGQTIKDKLKDRPLKLDEALDIAIQTATGLQAAHEKGVVHRDIKGANLMVTAEGQVKIMDFGLAQLAEQSRLTKTATILGTPAYMSPEQAQRLPTDRRTDIWSLGVVIHEMVTGRLPFEGERQEAVLYAIGAEEPEPITAQRAGLPMELEWIVGKAMAKDAAERYQHVDEMLVDLRRARETASSRGVHPKKDPSGSAVTHQQSISSKTLRTYQALLATTVAALFGLASLHFSETTPDAPLRRFGLTPSVAVASYPYFGNAAISPDGRHVAFAEEGDQGRLWVQDLGQNQPRPIDGTAGALGPFWSPGSDFIGFVADRELKKVPVQGGAPIRVCELPFELFGGASWSPDSKRIVFSARFPGILFEVSARGGRSQVLLDLPEVAEALQQPVTYLGRPHFLPAEAGPRTIMFTAWLPQAGGNHLVVRDLAGGTPRVVGPGDFPYYSPSGHIVYQASYGTYGLWALPFSLDRLDATGEAFLVAEDGRAPTVAEDGTLVYSAATSSGPERLVWVDRKGERTEPTGLEHKGIRNPVLSPDGKLVAVTLRERSETGAGGPWGGWLYDLARGTRTRLGGIGRGSVWSSTGQQVAYISNQSGTLSTVVQRIDGRAQEQIVKEAFELDTLHDWSKDGEYLISTSYRPETQMDISYLKRGQAETADWQRHTFVGRPFSEKLAQLSPDGRHIAYVSDESGRDEVYVQRFPAGVRKVPISARGGTRPRWSRDGNDLFYVEDKVLVAVSVSIEPLFEVRSATRLFEHPGLAKANIFVQTYDVPAEGSRFLLVEPASSGSIPELQIRVVEKWFSEFRDRAQD